MTDPVNPTLIAAYAGDVPDPADPASYGVRGRALWAWETLLLFTGSNTLAAQAYTNALAAFEAAQAAELNANFKGAWSGLTGALNKPAVVSHSGSRWTLLNNLANVTTSTPGVSADWQLYQPLTAAGISYSPAGTPLTETLVQTAITKLALNAAADRNLIRNRNLREVNRTRLWAGPYVMTAGQFLCDAWRAGAGGCTATEPTGSTTISAGTLVQTVFTSTIYAYDTMDPPASTPVTITWSGTAQARVNGGSYSASPLTYTPANMPVSFELEFNAGTLSKPRAHLGTHCPEWVALNDIEAQHEADFDFQELEVTHRWDAGGAAGQLGLTYPLSTRMRTGTTAAWGTATTNTNIAGTPSLTLLPSRRSVSVVATSTAAGAAQYTNKALLSSGA
jgi:hypothetical protein